jgi:hypothetical protein
LLEPLIEKGQRAAMSETTLRGWAKTRTLGQSAFILKYGILGWGVPTAILWSVLVAADEGLAALPILLLFALTLFPVGGYVFGRVLWAVLERSHTRSRSAE